MFGKVFRLGSMGLVILTCVLAATLSSPGIALAKHRDTERIVVVYCGRSKALVAPVFEKFTKKTGIKVVARYGDTAELVGLIQEEGKRTLADVFFAQDAGALGALSHKGYLQKLPHDVLASVDKRYRASDDTWVGISGRARTIVYSTASLNEEDVPDSVFDLTDAKWKGKVGWAPTNGSFQAFVTAMRKSEGDRTTATWLSKMVENDVREYPKNSPIVQAVGSGEIQLGLVNHYYLYRYKERDPNFPAENKFTKSGDPGSLVNVAGVGIVQGGSTVRYEVADALINYLLGKEAQEYFSSKTYEYPLSAGVQPTQGLRPLAEINPPDISLGDLNDLQMTLKMLRAVGAIP